MKSKKLGKTARLIAAIYVLIIGSLILINQLADLLTPYKSGDKVADLLATTATTISTLMAFIWSGFLIYASYTLFKGKRDNFLSIVTWLILIGIVGVSINYATSKYDASSSFGYNPFLILFFYLVPIILIFISWKAEPKKGENSIERARRILGKHVQHLSDTELHHTLK